MEIPFKKYQGTGNDFILIDDRDGLWKSRLTREHIHFMCDRRFGIGADGVMLLGQSEKFDFSMIYFNSDGNKSSMCGNGGRCIVHFAHSLGLFSKNTKFEFDHDVYHAIYNEEDSLIALKMQDVLSIEMISESTYYLDTGSPHYVQFVKNQYPRNVVVNEGRAIRNNKRFKEIGTNVNFCTLTTNELRVDTYERGVEDFTFSCGTGVVASSLALCVHDNRPEGEHIQPIHTAGGNLKVSYSYKKNQFTNILLEGPAQCVFDGIIDI